MNNIHEYTDDSDSDVDNANYEADCEAISAMFPDAQFSVAMELDELDELLTNKTSISVKVTYTCYCYDYLGYKKLPSIYKIKGPRMTHKYVIEELIKQGLNLDCNHHFLEGFMPINKSDSKFEIVTGS